MKENDKKGLLYTGFIFLFLGCFLVAFLIGGKLNSGKNLDDNDEPASDYFATLYKCGDGIYNEDIYDNCYIMEIFNIESEDGYAVGYYSVNEVLYYDNGYKIMNVDNDKSTDFAIDDLEDFDIGLVKTDKGLLEGFNYKKDDKFGYYNLNENKNMYYGIYDELYFDNEYLKGVVDAEGLGKTEFIDLKEEKVKISSGYCGWIIEKTDFIVVDDDCLDNGSYDIYTLDYKKIATDVQSYYSKDGIISFAENNVIVTYDKDGKKVDKSNNYQEILDYNNGYVVYLKDNKLMFTDQDLKMLKKLLIELKFLKLKKKLHNLNLLMNYSLPD